MEYYSKSDIDVFVNNAKKKFDNFSNEIFSDYSKYLSKLKESNKKLLYEKAFDKKEKLEFQLDKFIEANFPKTDEFIINGVTQYSVETIIYFNLLVDCLIPSHKKLNKLYQEFLESFRDNNP